MKTRSASNLKDNVAAATVLTATFIAIMGSVVTSNDARADKASQVSMQRVDVQLMETMLITAPRIPAVVTMETMMVTASRHPENVAKFVLASN